MKTILLINMLFLSGCVGLMCDKTLETNLAAHDDGAYTKWAECNRRVSSSAAAFQHGMEGVSRSYSEKSHIYSDQLPRNYNIHFD